MKVDSSRGPYGISFLQRTEDVVCIVESFLSDLAPSMVIVLSNQTVCSLYGQRFLLG